MPTLVRLFVVLLVFAGIALAGMVALTTFVDPGQKEIRVRIQPNQLGVQAPSNDPLGLRVEAEAPAQPAAAPAATTVAEEPAPVAAPAAGGAQTPPAAAEAADAAATEQLAGDPDESGVREVDIPE